MNSFSGSCRNSHKDFFLDCSCNFIRNISEDIFRDPCRVWLHVPPEAFQKFFQKLHQKWLKNSLKNSWRTGRSAQGIPQKLIEKTLDFFRDSWTNILKAIFDVISIPGLMPRIIPTRVPEKKTLSDIPLILRNKYWDFWKNSARSSRKKMLENLCRDYCKNL